MNHRLTAVTLAELVSTQTPPCLSLYQPTHRSHPDNQQDPIRFHQLLQTLESALRQNYPAAETQPLLAPFVALAEDREFWNHTLDGLAVLGNVEMFRVFLLQRPVDETAEVGDHFHLTPLRRVLQTIGRYQLLTLSLNQVRLFEGSRDQLDEIDPLPDVPRSMEQALGTERAAQRQSVLSSGGAHSPMHHGQGGHKDEADKEAHRYFRAVDLAVLEQHSRPSGLPLILACLPEHQHAFRKVSHNPLLLTGGIAIDPETLSTDELRERAWQVVEPQHEANMVAWTEAFNQARAHGLGSDELVQIGNAAAAGRVATLLIEADRLLAGQLNAETGQIRPVDLDDSHTDDLLDDLGDLVERKGGQVVVMRAARMPGQTGLAATFRY